MAGKAVANIRINLTAVTAKFNKGMKTAGGVVSKFAGMAGRVLKNFAKIGVASIAAVTAAMVALGKRSAELLDDLGKTADTIGITTEGLASLQGERGIQERDIDVR